MKVYHDKDIDESVLEGKTVAVITLNKEDVRLMKDKEILHARKLQTV